MRHKIILFAKFSLFLITVLGIVPVVEAQNTYYRQLKYWYLRDRLRYFIAKSDDPLNEDGSFLVIANRNCDWPNKSSFTDVAGYGQQSSLFGKYLGVLATEYYLLNHFGFVEEANETKEELQYALLTQKRRDLSEHHRNCLDDYNGFFLINDIPDNLYNAWPWNNPLFVEPSEINSYAGILLDSDPLLDPNSLSPSIRPVTHVDGGLSGLWGPMSQDEAIFTLEGLALAYKFGDTDSKDLARELAEKILSHCFGNGNWYILDCDGTNVPDGYDCNNFSYGYVSIEQFFNLPLHGPNVLTWWEWFMIISQGAGTSTNCHMAASLAAIGNSWAPFTQGGIYNNCDEYGWQPYYLWLYKALWDDSYDFINVGNVEDRLDEAPCEGPWKQSESIHAENGWASNDKWYHEVEEQGGTGNKIGIFSGIDYMILLNLYYIASAINSTDCYPYRNMVNSIADKQWPSGNNGSIILPWINNTFRTVRSTEKIASNPIPGDVYYFAGESIFLEPGFAVEKGANFNGKILPLGYCSNQSLSRQTANSVDSNPIIDDESLGPYQCAFLAEEIIDENTIRIYPNPTDGILHVDNPNCEDIIEILLQTISGKSILIQECLVKCDNTIDISQYDAGVYFIKIVLRSGVITKKIIKK